MELTQFVQQGDTHSSGFQQSVVSSMSEETQFWLQKDASVFLHQALSTPVMNVLSSATGPYIFDLDGNQYLDLHGNGVHNIGFNNPEVVKAIIHQITEQLTFTPRRYTTVPTIQFAEKLVSMAPGMSRLLLCPGGSEAIEMAVMLAKQVTGKWKTISFWNQYHGNTYQAATLSGNKHFTSGMGPMVPGAFHVHYPNYYRNPFGVDPENVEAIDTCYLAQMRNIFEHNDGIAAVVGTTVSSTPSVPSKRYWQEVRKMCVEYGAFLIFDEIVCGLGRTGKMFAYEHFVEPDVVVLGKSLGGGILPLAGILTKEEHNVVADYSIGHYTHEKSPIGAASGMAMLKFMTENHVVENANRIGNYLFSGLANLKNEEPSIGNVTGMGMLLAIDVCHPNSNRRFPQKANDVLTYCFRNGISFKIIDGNVLTLRPALIIDEEHADFIIRILSEAFANT